MLNRTADHALRAVLFVAQRAGQRSCSSGEIAAALDLPRNYLGKVLYALTGAGVLSSVRGPRGGFRIAQRADVITVADVAAPFQRTTPRHRCLQANRPCDVENPCTAHVVWQATADHINDLFRATTIAQLLADHTEAPPTPMNGETA